MTEKRFTLTFDDKIIDNLTGIIHDVHSGYDVAMDLSGLLNVLNDENEQLKSYIGEMEDYLARLEEKNEQLKNLCKTLIKHIEKKSIAFIIDDEVRELLE